MMLLHRLRAIGIAGTGVVWGCIWPLALLCASVVVSWGLWDALGWSSWILWIGFGLLSLGMDHVFVGMVFVAFIAGFFKAGAWGWSLGVAGVVAFPCIINLVLYARGGCHHGK